MKGWETIWNPEVPHRVQVLPHNDLMEHEPGFDCLCGPVHHISPGLVVEVHHSLDGREHEIR